MFYSERLGLAATGGWAGDAVWLYGEFDGLLVLPPDDISDDAVQAGIYGLFADAEKLPGKPDYYSGFTIKTGWRYYFR